jgi:hypothetical protein
MPPPPPPPPSLDHLGFGLVPGPFFFYAAGSNLPADVNRYRIAITDKNGAAAAGFSGVVVGFPSPDHTIIRIDYEEPLVGGMVLEDLQELSITITVTVLDVNGNPILPSQSLTLKPDLDVSAQIDPTLNPEPVVGA